MEESYNGTESGIIVQTQENEIVERPGTLVLIGEKLVGGWAKVHRKDRAMPEYKSVDFATYDIGYSRWKKDPGGMIMKVARSQALRAAFPTALGGLYTQEEMQRVTEMGEDTARAPVSMPKRLSEATEAEPQPGAQPPAGQQADAAKKEPEPADADDGEQTISGIIETVNRKPGKSSKGEYVKCGICVTTATGDVWVNTFNTDLADAAEAAKGQKGDFIVKQGKYGMDLIDFGLPENEA